MPERKTPILLRRGPLSGDVMALTRYTRKIVNGRELLTSSVKQAVTYDYYSLMLEELVDDGCENIVGILDGAADGEVLDDEQRGQVRIFRERLRNIIVAHNARIDKHSEAGIQ